MQVVIGILIGMAGLVVLTGLSALLYYLRQASANLKRAADVFAKSAEMANSIAAQVVATRQQVAATEQMTAVIRAFNGLVLKGGGGDEPPLAAAPRQSWGRTPPPPPVASYDEFAGEDESGVLSQTEEEQVELEVARMAREQGMEVDLDMTQIPPLSAMRQVEE
jgi:hypothetical protein